jgi:hypothetical protein
MSERTIGTATLPGRQACRHGRPGWLVALGRAYALLWAASANVVVNDLGGDGSSATYLLSSSPRSSMPVAQQSPTTVSLLAAGR